MNFKGKAQRLDSFDITAIARTIGCGEDHLHAVMEVETRGGGFDRFGRLKMLFEPHIFYRELSGANREQAVKAGLAYRHWGEKPYPSDSYPRLQDAMLIDVDAALRSCSWGLGQIMGFNHRLAGYSSAKAMIEAFVDDEAVHLAAMVEFIVGSGLDDELRNEDWRGFARGYNGAGYAHHGYHLKLKAAFDKWQRIPDTPFKLDRTLQDPNPPVEPVLTTRGMVLKRGMQGPDVENLQGILKRLRYHVGRIDGHFGQITHGAVVAFQSDNDLVPDGLVGELTWKALSQADARPQRDLKEEDLIETSRIAGTADKGRKLMGQAKKVIGGGLTVGTTLEAAQAFTEAEPVLTRASELLATHWPLLLVCVFLFALAHFSEDFFKKIGGWRMEDAREGKTL